MRIAFFNDDGPAVVQGGDVHIVHMLRKNLSARGHTVTLVTSHLPSVNSSIVRTHDDAGAVISLPISRSKWSQWHCIRRPAVSRMIERVLADIQPDIVHAHIIHLALTYDTLRLAAAHTSRIFLTAHDTFLVSFGRVNGNAYRRAALHHRPYRMHWYDHLLAAGRRYNPLRNGRIRSVLRSTGTQVIAVSHAINDFLAVHGIDSTVIHNAIEAKQPVSAQDVAAFRTRHAINGPCLLVGGRLNEDKGIPAALRAFSVVRKEVPQATLLIVGEAERIRPFLQDCAPDVREFVRTTGWLSSQEMRTAYAACDVVTTPSIYLDAFNLMNVEAMIQRKPVIGTCFGGTPEIVEDGHTGFIVNPLDTVAYAQKIVHLLRDLPLAQTMGEAGAKRVLKLFMPESFIEKHLSLYQAATSL